MNGRCLRWLAVLAVFAALHDAVTFAPSVLAGEVLAADAAGGTPVTPVARNEHPASLSNAADQETGEDAEHGGHQDPVAPVLLAIILILLLAKFGGDLSERVGMPAVLGELIVGIILGNFGLMTGWHGLDFLKAPPEGIAGSPYNTGAVIKILAGIGVILLLFEVGLESSIREMMLVGTSSILVAVLGVVAPMVLGYVAGVMLLPKVGWTDWEVPAFIGATLCATSVGITARVLKDINRSQQKESQIILGAAVIDDVLGLIVLAVVSGLITAQAATAAGDSGGLAFQLFKIIGLAVGFLAGALVLGAVRFPRAVFRAASFLRGHGLLVAISLVICFGFAWLANQVGLATIVGAFAAGLILEGTHYRELGAREEHNLEEALAPLTALLVPIFFVEMGIEVDLASFTKPEVWGLALAITVAAIVGKQVCSFGVREPGLNKAAVGLGMIPRGEVGLIFANEGRKLVADGQEVIGPGTYSAIVVMVMLTTVATPPLLKWSLLRGERNRNDESSAPER